MSSVSPRGRTSRSCSRTRRATRGSRDGSSTATTIRSPPRACSRRSPSPVLGIRLGLHGELVLSDAEGRFELRNVSREVDQLFVTVSGSAGSTTVRLQNEPNVESITVHVARPCHIQVDLSGSKIEADSFAVLDEKGKMLGLSVQHGDWSGGGDGFASLLGGHSEAMSTSDNARKLVLQLHGKKVVEIPLHLVADQLNVIRP